MRERPPYLRTADVLRQRIKEQEWSPGDRLPSRTQLAQECEATEAVVRRAQELLIAQGVLVGRGGSGTYVAEPRERVCLLRSPERERTEGSPFYAGTVELGKHGSWDSRSDPLIPAPADIAERLGIQAGAYCVRTSYVFLADGKPVQLSISWEPYEITSGTLVVLPEAGPHAGRGVVGRMAEIGVTVVRAVERPEPGHANAGEANLLGIQRGALVTRIQRTYFSNDGRAVETADIVVPTSLCEIVYEVPVT
ncbi:MULTISPECIES: GntR family transcriptional regulator [Streptomyces]|uniref:UTRA domain-containing protein n=1 Tax=Streptomyces luteosporeus TaxID=173856 RepID=A0ABP6FZR7_9ACTN